MLSEYGNVLTFHKKANAVISKRIEATRDFAASIRLHICSNCSLFGLFPAILSNTKPQDDIKKLCLSEEDNMDTPQQHRVTCSVANSPNPKGKSKLYATITQDGITVWCKLCKRPHLVPREQMLSIWFTEEEMQQLKSTQQGALLHGCYI